MYNRNGKVQVLIECKAPTVKIKQTVFNQISKYNLVLKSKYLMITNGINHYFFVMNFKAKKIEFIKELPSYEL